MQKPLHIFCCYARADQPYLLELRNRLIPFQRAGLITVHADIDISPGENWGQKIRSYLNTAHIILLLVSPDFLASDYCWSTEMARALERHREGNAQVIPIILRPVDLQHLPFSAIQALPTNAQPITKWLDRDDAFLDVANGIREAIEKLLQYSSSQPASLISSTNVSSQRQISSKLLREDQELVQTYLMNAWGAETYDKKVSWLNKRAEIFEKHGIIEELLSTYWLGVVYAGVGSADYEKKVPWINRVV